MKHEKVVRHPGLFQFAADLLAVIAAYYMAFLFRFRSEAGLSMFTKLNRALGFRSSGAVGETLERFYVDSAPRIILIVLGTLFVLYSIRDLYPGRRFLRRRPVAWNVIVANGIALALFFVYFYLRRNVFHPRSFFITLLVFNVVCCVGFRSLFDSLLTGLRARFGYDRCPAVLIGHSREADVIDELIQGVHPHGIDIAARVEFDPESPFDEAIRALEDEIRQHAAEMIVAADKRMSIAQIMEILQLAATLDVAVKVLSDKMDVIRDRAGEPVDIVYGIPLVHFERPSLAREFAPLRHTVAVAAAALALAALLPLLGLIALVIRLSSRGPALFVQERIGVNRRAFRMLKFRTMWERAEELQAQVEEFNESGRGLFKIRKDPRVTPVGRFLRRFSLDELPQLVNVLRGDMTLVGPRPLPRRDFENYYEEWHYSRHAGRPGLTCLWQISGRSNVDFHNMCILDVYYLRNQSWVMDLKIVLMTVWVVLFAKGAY